MAHVVTEACLKCRYTSCVEVCPVDCFRGGEDMLVIDPDKCIDCGLCVPACPAQAIWSDTADRMVKWAAFNRKWSRVWPSIKQPESPHPEAEMWKTRDKIHVFKEIFRDN